MLRNIKIDDLTNFKFLSQLNYSPKNKNISCFVVASANIEKNNYDKTIWMHNFDTHQTKQLTAFNNEGNYIWLQDGENILFNTLREDDDKKALKEGKEFSKFYKININGGEAIPYFTIPLCVESIWQIDKDNFIFTARHKVGEKPLYLVDDNDKEDELKRRNNNKDYEVLDEIPFWSNGEGFTNKNRNGLYKFNLKTKEISPITDEYTSVSSVALNSNKSTIVMISNSFTSKALLADTLSIYDIKEGTLSNLYSDENLSYSIADFINDDELILCYTNMMSYGINENSKIYTLNLNTMKRKIINENFDIAIGNSLGSDCRLGSGNYYKIYNNNFYFISTENSNTYLNVIRLNDDKIEKLTKCSGSVDCFDINDNGICFIGMRGLSLQEIYTLSNNKEEFKCTNFNSLLNNNLKTSAPISMNFRLEDGTIIEGYVIKPTDFDDNKKYPGILDIHGGPKTVYGTVYYHEMQLWANMGYFVFFCNPRGSDGRGNKFADIRGKYGTIDYDDLMLFTDKVLDQYPNIDKNRLGVTGGSYGGFMTNWIIGHTHRFKAAASQRSISNWISKFCTTDIGYYFVDDQQLSTPWKNTDKLWFHSPLKYADKVTTPTLFIHSENDYRCWLAEGLQMFTALKYHGVDARLCMFKGENHNLSRSGKPKHRIRRLTEITNWFEKYLK